MMSIAASLFGMFGLAFGLYYSLGKLEPNTVRMIATGSICLTPVLAVISLAMGQYLYKIKVAGLHDGIETARDAWHEVSVGVGKVAQARHDCSQSKAPTVVYPYPMGLVHSQPTGMIIEQRDVPDAERGYYE
jgi:hypothetical protein